jgi:hypothetical protein
MLLTKISVSASAQAWALDDRPHYGILAVAEPDTDFLGVVVVPYSRPFVGLLVVILQRVAQALPLFTRELYGWRFGFGSVLHRLAFFVSPASINRRIASARDGRSSICSHLSVGAYAGAIAQSSRFVTFQDGDDASRSIFRMPVAGR